jgi:hypothetical protein
MTAGSRWKFAASLLAASLLLPGCSGDETLEPDEATALYDLSSGPVRAQLLVEFLVAPIERMRDHWAPEEFAAARAAIDAQFSPAAVKRAVVARLQDAPSSPHLETVLSWLRSEPVRRVIAAQAASLSPDASAAIQELVTEASPPSPERLELIDRYDRTARVSRDLTNEMLLANYGVALMAESRQPRGERRSREQLKQIFLPDEEVLGTIFAELTAMSTRLAFHEFSDQELASFVARCESDAGRWYYRTFSTAFLGGIEELADGLGDAFSSALSAPDDT